MDSTERPEIEMLLQKGVAELEKGSLKNAHQAFLDVLKADPSNIKALVYAAASSATQQEAAAFVKRLQVVAPGHPSIQRALEWVKILPEKPDAVDLQVHRQDWVSQPIQPPQKKQSKGCFGLGLVFILGLVIIFIVFARLFLNNKAAPPYTPPVSLESPVPSALSGSIQNLPPTWTVTVSPTAEPPTLTPLPYITATPLPTVVMQYFPLLESSVYLSNPQAYVGKQFSLKGQIITFGEVEVNGKLEFGLIIQPGNPAATLAPQDKNALYPVLVIDAILDPNFRTGQWVQISGVGIDDSLKIRVALLNWNDPVISAQKVEYIQQ